MRSPRLSRARDAYAAGGERVPELLALGYLALARGRQGTPERHRNELEEICQQLQKDGSPQAIAFVNSAANGRSAVVAGQLGIADHCGSILASFT